MADPIYINNSSGVSVPVSSSNPVPVVSAGASMPVSISGTVPISTSGPLQTVDTPVNTFLIAPGALGPTVVKNTPGTFFGIIVNTVGVGAPVAYDNASAASGTPVGNLVSSATLGLFGNIPTGIKCSNGITVSGGLTNPGMTILYT